MESGIGFIGSGVRQLGGFQTLAEQQEYYARMRRNVPGTANATPTGGSSVRSSGSGCFGSGKLNVCDVAFKVTFCLDSFDDTNDSWMAEASDKSTGPVDSVFRKPLPVCGRKVAGSKSPMKVRSVPSVEIPSGMSCLNFVVAIYVSFLLGGKMATMRRFRFRLRGDAEQSSGLNMVTNSSLSSSGDFAGHNKFTNSSLTSSGNRSDTTSLSAGGSGGLVGVSGRAVKPAGQLMCSDGSAIALSGNFRCFSCY